MYLTLKLTFRTNTVLNVKKCICWCLSIIEIICCLENYTWYIKGTTWTHTISADCTNVAATSGCYCLPVRPTSTCHTNLTHIMRWHFINSTVIQYNILLCCSLVPFHMTRQKEVGGAGETCFCAPFQSSCNSVAMTSKKRKKKNIYTIGLVITHGDIMGHFYWMFTVMRSRIAS